MDFIKAKSQLSVTTKFEIAENIYRMWSQDPQIFHSTQRQRDPCFPDRNRKKNEVIPFVLRLASPLQTENVILTICAVSREEHINGR